MCARVARLRQFLSSQLGYGFTTRHRDAIECASRSAAGEWPCRAIPAGGEKEKGCCVKKKHARVPGARP